MSLRTPLGRVLGKARVALEPRPTSKTLHIRLGRRASGRLASISRTFAATLRFRTTSQAAAHVPDTPTEKPDQVPVKAGLRLSMKALRPSI